MIEDEQRSPGLRRPDPVTRTLLIEEGRLRFRRRTLQVVAPERCVAEALIAGLMVEPDHRPPSWSRDSGVFARV